MRGLASAAGIRRALLLAAYAGISYVTVLALLFIA